MNKDPLVKVFAGGRPGEYVKMRKSHAEKQGLPWEPEKRMIADENKMMIPEEDKSTPLPQGDNVVAPVESEVCDFTEISGLGKATNEALHAHGIHTFEALKSAEIDFLSGRVVRTIEKWRSDHF